MCRETTPPAIVWSDLAGKGAVHLLEQCDMRYKAASRKSFFRGRNIGFRRQRLPARSELNITAARKFYERENRESGLDELAASQIVHVHKRFLGNVMAASLPPRSFQQLGQTCDRTGPGMRQHSVWLLWLPV